MGPSCASSPSISTSMEPKKLMFSLCAGFGADHPLPAGHARRRRGPVPARGPADDPQGQPRPDRRALGRPAAAGRVAEVRARHRLPAGRQALGVGTPEHAGRCLEGVRGAAAHDLRREVPGRSGLPAQDLPPAQQGRNPCTRCAAICSTPTKARSGPASSPTRPSRRGV